MRKTIYLLAIALTMSLFYGCKKDEPTPEPTPEPVDPCGIYLGVIGFNYDQYVKDICQLTKSNQSEFNSFIDNLTPEDGTGLYYANYLALNMLQNYAMPPKLKNVIMVTFTDGLDNVSLDSEHNPEHYTSTSEYREALHNRILNQQIHGIDVSAFSIGLRGNDVSDVNAFRESLRSIASDNRNVFEVSNMDQALQTFTAIADSLHSISTSVNLVLQIQSGYDDGQRLRFNIRSNPTAYIQVTHRRNANGTITLENISYYGLQQGETTISSDSIVRGKVYFTFPALRYTDGSNVSTLDIANMELLKETSTGNWDNETEFKPGDAVHVNEEKNSALIMLVLDCTTSLGSDFGNMQYSGKSFVETLLNASSNKKKTNTKRK